MAKTKIISAIHFVLISFITFILLLAFYLTLLLHNTITLQELSLKGVTCKALTLGYDDALTLSIDSVVIAKSNSKSVDTGDIFAFAKRIGTLLKLFQRIEIAHIQNGDSNASLLYRNAKLRLRVRTAYAEATLFAYDAQERIILNGTVRGNDDFLSLDFDGVLDFTTDTLYQIADITLLHDNKITLYATLRDKIMRFAAFANAPLRHKDAVTDRLIKNRAIAQWVAEFAKAKRYYLTSAYGEMQLDNPASLLQSLRIKAYAEDVAYTFAQGFQPAYAKRVDILFDNATLHIIPKNATFYGQSGGATRVDIDFSRPNVTLRVDIDTTARLDANLLRLIAHYGIDIPVLQKSGATRTKLAIEVKLRTREVSARGVFHIKDAAVIFEGEEFFIKSGIVRIDGGNVTLKSIDLRYKDILHAQLDANIAAARQKGKFTLFIDDLHVSDRFALAKPVRATYTMRPKGYDYLQIDPARWRFFDYNLTSDLLQADFDFDSLNAYIHKTKLHLSDNVASEFFGEANIKKRRFHFTVALEKMAFDKLKLHDTPLHVNIYKNDTLHIRAKEPIRLDFDGSAITLDNIHAKIDEENLSVEEAVLDIDSFVHTKFDANIPLEGERATMTLYESRANESHFGELLRSQDKIELRLRYKDDYFDIDSQRLQFAFSGYNGGWRIDFDDIAQLAPYSKPLSDFNITDGSLTLFSYNNRYRFSGRLDYAYPFLVENNTPQHDYRFVGDIEGNTTTVELNDKVSVRIDKDILLEARDIGFNITAFVDFLRDHNHGEGRKKRYDFTIKAENTFLYLTPKRRALADSIFAQAHDDRIIASLIYKKGGAGLEMQNDRFFLYGQQFNDTFMNNLLAFSKFKGGAFSFALQGDLERFKGVARIDDTRLQEYVVLNNILAFINTVPSLATFSLPSYSKKGLVVKEAYAAFRYAARQMEFETIKMDAEEIEMYGFGKADYLRDSIDLTLNLKTDIGKNLSKVPVVGYILVGDDNTAITSLHITGKLSDPKIESLMAQDIVVAPFNILKRAIIYPYHLIESLQERNETKKFDATRFLRR